jgi:hypothetical protein
MDFVNRSDEKVVSGGMVFAPKIKETGNEEN